MEQIVEWAYRLLVLLGLGGGLYLLKALKGTVDAQRETIDAQAKKIEAIEGLQRTMETVLKSTDEKNMLARLQAHKEFVEHEKAADAKRLTDRFEEEKQKMFRAAETGTREAVQKYAVPLIDSLISLARNALPYVPKSRRQGSLTL